MLHEFVILGIFVIHYCHTIQLHSEIMVNTDYVPCTIILYYCKTSSYLKVILPGVVSQLCS